MLAYVMSVIGLLALLVGAFTSAGRPSPTATLLQTSGPRVVSQVQAIRAEVLACVTGYPGDNGTGVRPPYPGAPEPSALEVLTCPGKADTPAGNNLLLPLPSLPVQIPGMSAWAYVNDASSVRLELSALDAGHVPVLEFAAGQIGPAASVSGQRLTVLIKN